MCGKNEHVWWRMICGICVAVVVVLSAVALLLYKINCIVVFFVFNVVRFIIHTRIMFVVMMCDDDCIYT